MMFSNFHFLSCLPKINRTKMALTISALMILAGTICAQTLTDIGATAPTPGVNDVSQLSTSGNTTFPDYLNYYTDNQSRHSGGEPGQTFTTGTNSSGYTLTSVSLRTAGLGSYGNISTLQPYYLHLYSVSGGNVTLLQTYTSANFTFNDGDWLQWSGLSLVLAANATYAWSFGNASSAVSWEAMGVASGNPYAGGEIGLIPPGGGAITYGSSHGFGAVFDVGLVSATLPSINQLTLSPTNNVFAGTAVTFTASVSGALPLHYQWQFSSGGGYTNISGANTNTLALTAAIANTGSYQLVLTNNYGAVTSAPVALTVTAATINPVTVSPTNSVFVGTMVTFAASVSGTPPLHFQWQGNTGGSYTNIPGANTNTFVLTAAIASTGLYQLVVTNSYGAVTSAPVALTVTLDTIPPAVLRAINIGPTNVEVDFSKALEAASATTVANYALTNGTAISGASLSANGTTVILTTAPLVYGSNYTLVINGVRDLAVPPNTIATNTRVSFTASPRGRILLDAGWRFQLGDPGDVTTNVTVYTEIPDLAKLEDSGSGAELTGANSETNLMTLRPDPVATHAGENVSFVMTNYNDSAWRALNLPHDWVVELGFDSGGDGGHGFKATSGNTIGWYRRTFTLPSADAGKVMWLEFDGIYRNALIWFNGHCIGRDVSGYAPIHFDVTPYANPGGTNVLLVRVDATRSEGWFYEGAGIYRHVWLVTTDPVHVGHWGTYLATTSLAGSNATIAVQTTVTNQSALAVTGSLTATILDTGGNSVTAATAALTLAAGQGLIVTQTLSVANANLWSLQTPYLYNLVSTVSNQNAVADIYNTPFGVRTVSIDSTNGVFINGQHVWIQGMCNHQDHAGVGSALPDRLQYFRIERLKQMGVNAYRTSHNTPTAELLEACDRLGMLVLDENRRCGSDPESLGQLQRMVLRDRNHPSVFCWSLANEEFYVQGNTNGVAVMTAMQNLVHSLDSTRLCTAALNSWGSGFSSVLDVNGFNYQLGQPDSVHADHPGWPIIGTETSSQVTDRGIYTNDTVNGYVWGYDLIPVSWGETAEAWWQYYSARPWSSGGFCWTGFDYRGEPTPYWWPCINSHFGILDMCGFPKDLFYYYQANWTLKPVLHLFPHWNWSTPGQPINIWAFGNCDLVELFTNGVSAGRQTLNVKGHVEWDNVPYAPGTLQVIGYNNGVAVITNTVVTTGAPAQIALWPDRSTILADGRDVSVVTVAVLDAQGNVVPTASNTVTFAVTGGAIIGVGNGDPSSHEADKASQRSVFNGLAEVIVQSINQPGTITLSAASTGLTSTNITITAPAALPPPAAPAGVAAVEGNTQVTVSWDIVPGATTYNLWRATTSGGPYTLIAGNIGGVNLGYTNNNVTNLTTYYYVVTANGSGTSVNSAEVSATPQAPPVPAAPTGLTAIPDYGQVSLSWTGSSGATNYNVKRSATSNGSYTTVTNTATTSVVNTGLTNGITYYFEVSALNTSGESANSDWVSARPTALVSTNLLINPGFELPGTGKIINGYATVPGWTNSGTTYSDTGVQPGGHSGAWEGYGQSSDDGTCQIVGNYQIQTGDQFTLTWWSQGEWNGTNSSYAGTNSSDPFQTVTLLRAAATNTAFSSTVRLALQTNGMPGGTWTSYTLTYTAGTADAGKYIGVSFVTSKNSGKTGGTWAAYDDFSLKVVSIPPAPGGLNASAGNGQVILNWNPVANASGYYIKRSLVSGSSYTVIFTNLTSLAFTNTGLTNGTTYYYVVSAFNLAGAGASSTEVSASPTNAPPVISWVVPTNNSIFIRPKTLNLTAVATDPDGTVTNVAFFNGATLLGNAASGAGSQFSLTWSNAAVGSYTLSALATDNSGATNKSPATINLVVQPLTLTASGTQNNGQFVLTFQGENGQNYVLETSTNLLTGWTRVWTNAPANGVLTFTNDNATDQARFYRVSQ
jgi:beta-galactosidase